MNEEPEFLEEIEDIRIDAPKDRIMESIDANINLSLLKTILVCSIFLIILFLIH